jgi:site-specific recombinase XerD
LFITLDLWPDFKSYLVIEKKLSDKSSSLYALKSRFNRLTSNFSQKDFNKSNFNLLIAEMKGQDHAPSYLNNMIKMAKHLDKFLRLNELQDYSYFRETYTPTKEVLTPEEIKNLAEIEMKYKFPQFMNHRQKALIYLLGTTGCRIGEVIDLKWDDLFTDHVIFRDTKNGDSRVVPISSELYQLLSELPRKRVEVFASYRGSKLASPQINSDLQKRAKTAGISKHIYNHLLRHSFITTMLEQGVDSLDVAVIVGHKDPKNTMRYKNSLLSHYKTIIQFHPLLKKTMTFEQASLRLRDLVYKTINTETCRLSVREENGKMVVELARS